MAGDGVDRVEGAGHAHSEGGARQAGSGKAAGSSSESCESSESSTEVGESDSGYAGHSDLRNVASELAHISSSLGYSSLHGEHVEVDVGFGGSSLVGVLVAVVVAGLLGSVTSVLCSKFLFVLEFGVFDVDAIFVDVSLLVVGAELFLVVADEEDVLVGGGGADVVGEFLDVLLVELVEEVDDQSAGHLIDLDPGRLDLPVVRLQHALGLVDVVLVELLGLDDVEAEVVILPGGFLGGGDGVLGGLVGEFVEEEADGLLGGVLADDGDDDGAGVLDVAETGVDEGVSELGTGVLEGFVGLEGLLVGGEGDVGPGADVGVDGGVDVADVPLGVLALDELLDLVGEGGGVLLGVVLDALDVQHVRLILLRVLVDLRFGVAGKGFVLVDQFRDVVEDHFVLVLDGGFEGGAHCLCGGRGSAAGDLAGLLDVADVEEDASVAEGLLVLLGVGDGDLVDFDVGAEEGLDDPLNLLLKLLVVEVGGLVVLDLLFFEAGSLEFEHHLGEVFGDDGAGDSDLLLQDGGPVEGLLHVEGVVFRAVVDEGEALAFLVLGGGVAQAVDGLDVEVVLDHRSRHALLEAAHEDTAGELLLLLLLLVRQVVGVDQTALGTHASGDGEVGLTELRHGGTQGRVHEGVGVQLFHYFGLLRTC